MASKKKEGAQFVRYFGPLLDALRTLGGSARPSEATYDVDEAFFAAFGQTEKPESSDERGR